MIIPAWHLNRKGSVGDFKYPHSCRRVFALVAVALQLPCCDRLWILQLLRNRPFGVVNAFGWWCYWRWHCCGAESARMAEYCSCFAHCCLGRFAVYLIRLLVECQTSKAKSKFGTAQRQEIR